MNMENKGGYRREVLASKERLALEDVTVLMPIGGKATRAQAVTNDQIPKHLIPLGNEQTVFDVISGRLQDIGFRKFVFCVGHHKDLSIQYLDRGSWIKQPDVSYATSIEDRPLGADGAVLQAIRNFNLQGQAFLIPGDVFIPWQAIRAMNEFHRTTGADLTLGVTSHTTERMVDVGKIIVEDETNRMLWCYDRDSEDAPLLHGAQNLTSAACTVVSIEQYLNIYEAYTHARSSNEGVINARDGILGWAIRTGDFQIRAFDVGGEILDLGAPSNIRYGQQNWRDYA